ncbi:hypothetical protein [Paenibacillus qinlingensis]|uniref:Uncharacterized protein n=1 Tax=Paenibacillus qinlingensis TaxID=1837343 RepID=A0ABU1NRD3_9BACL|nr:hypothetical protein [Paenibacillus qinlingensis]MDR6550047.1 hypothetical protein [Paenibacillus qinlingensis]
MKRIVLTCVFVTSIVLSQLLSSPATAVEAELLAKKLPTMLILTEKQTAMYDTPNGKQIGTTSAAVVNVLDAESGWQSHLIQESDPLIWYKISAEEGETWIKPVHPEFPEDFFEWIQTTGIEYLYDHPREQGKTLNTISPQPLKSVGTINGYYRIQTWLGYQWIKPKHQLVPYRIPVDETITLNESIPIFDVPEGDSQVNGYLSASQSVTAFERINREWFHIHTWLGEQWINLSYSLPKDLQTRNETIELKENTPLYEHPNRQANIRGTLAPQVVSAFESGSGWHHIESSWLGDAWVYVTEPAADPETYIPPSIVTNQLLAGDWQQFQYDPDSTGGKSGFPLAPLIGLDTNRGANKSDGIFPYGQPVPIRFEWMNASDNGIILKQADNLVIEISRVTGSFYERSQEVVWSGKLPVLNFTFKTRMQSAMITFDWDGKDSDGKQVPFGEYVVSLKAPLTIPNRIEGSQEEQLQKVAFSMYTRRPFFIGAP